MMTLSETTNNIVFIILGVTIGFILINAIWIIFYISNKKKKYNRQEKKVEEVIDESTNLLSSLFGSSDNIKEITNKGSRTTVEVKDISKIDEEKIKSTLEEVMFMGNKIIFVIGEKSSTFAKLLEEKIKTNKQ